MWLYNKTLIFKLTVNLVVVVVVDVVDVVVVVVVVSDLQVETQQSVKEGDSVTLTCKSSCSLPEQTTFIWYRETQRITDRTVNQLHLRSIRSSDTGNYRCGVTGHHHLISPAVHLNVECEYKLIH